MKKHIDSLLRIFSTILHRKDETIYRAIFEDSSTAIALLEENSNISLVNDAFCQLSGYSKDELLGTNWIQKIPPEERERLRTYNYQRLNGIGDFPDKYEFSFYTKEGELRYGLISVAVLKTAKKTVASFTDITDRKKTEETQRISEEHYRSLVEYANDIVYSITYEGIFIYASPNWKELLGHNLSDVIGHSFTEFVHPDDVPRLNELIRQNFESGEKLSDIEYKLRMKNGSWRWYSSSSSPIRNSEGKVITLIGIAHDITEQKQAELSLSQSEALLNTLVKTIPDLIWLKDRNGVYLSCNTMFERFFGAPKEQIIGKTDYDFVDHELADFFRENDRIAMEKGSPSINEEWITFADDGHKALLETVKTPMFGNEGNLIGILGIARDMTERKQMEKALQESEFLFKESQRVAFIGSYKVNFTTGFWESSEVLDQIFGIDKDYIRSIDEGWINLIYPDDRERMENYLLNEVITNHNPINAEYRIIRQSDKKTRWVNALGEVVLNNRNETILLIGTIQDITERKLTEQAIQESQNMLSMALKIAHLGPWEYDVVNDIYTFNDSFYALYHTNADKVGGYTMSMMDYCNHFVHPDDLEAILKEVVEYIDPHDPVYIKQIEHRIFYSDGQIGYIVVYFTVIPDKTGKIIKVFGISQDITEQKKSEKTLIESETLLRELNATKDKFFSIIAHDLRNPFSLLLGLSEIMVDNSFDLSIDEYRQNSIILYKTVSSTYSLLENLLEWSKLQRGITTIKKETILLRNFIDNLTETIKDMAIKKSIKLSVKIPPGFKLEADPNMLHSIFRNLITNAVKFTKEGGTVTITAKDHENGMILFSVKDNGIGMSSEIVNNLFRIDTNVSRPGTQNEPSSGLGLILCKEFIEKHEGKIWVESKIEKGSTFYFTIPTNLKVFS